MLLRILFVDDEPNILQGLKRMFRSQRHEWDMAFAESGREALELLEQESFDAVISDMRMPGMNGDELLNKVKTIYPKIIRFVLSGYSDQELIMRSIGSSHQYISKPCDPELLKRKLNDAFTLHELLESDTIRTVVAGMTSLPSFPQIYSKVVTELQSPDGEIMTIGELVEQDPAMTSKILQLVNSAYFGLSRKITSPSEAAKFLGMDILKSLVLSEGIFSQFSPEVSKILSIDMIKNNSLLVANAARQIAKMETTSEKVREQAFLAGLLHDLGTLVLAVNLPKDYIASCELVKNHDYNIWRAEKQIFGTTHAEVAAYLLGLWGIDDDVVAAVAFQYMPERYHVTQFSALTAVYVASAYIDKTMPGSNDSPFNEAGITYLESLNLIDHIPEWEELCNPVNVDEVSA